MYKAYDHDEGCEVAWNKLDASTVRTEKDRAKFNTEIGILKQLSHPSILKFTTAWVDKSNNVNFVTEMMTSGTLRQYVRRVKNVKIKIMQKWCRQILAALTYLHTRR